MRNAIKIFIAFAVIAGFSNCGGADRQKEEYEPAKNATGSNSAADHEAAPDDIAIITKEQMNAVGITLGVIKNKDLTATIKANGVLRVPNNNKANATSLYGGVIESLNVQLGDYVRKGQPIATIANPQFIQLQEEYLTIESSITLAGQEMQRQKELNEGSAGAMKNLQNATAQLNTLRTRKASLEQQIRLMGLVPASVSNDNLSTKLVVVSPITGTVSNVFANIGSYVDASFPVAEVVNNNLLHLDLQVFEKDLPKVRVGQEIHFVLTNNPEKTYSAKVFTIGSSFENESKTIAVHCNVIGDKTGLIDGMNITGIVSLSNVASPAVPDEAIVEADGKFYLFVQTDQQQDKSANHTDNHNVVLFRKVEIVKGVSDMGYTAIVPVTEIPANAQIAVRNAFFINAALGNKGEHNH